MASPPSPRTWIQNEIPSYATFQTEIYDTLAFLLEPPSCKVRQTSAQNLTTATYTAITFQSEDLDPYNWHSTTVNPSRITPTFPGWYRGWYSIGFSSQTGGNHRMGHVNKNGGSPAAANSLARRDTKPNVTATNTALSGIPFFWNFNGTTDYIELYGYQDCGSTMTLSVSSNITSSLFLRWWGPL